MRRTILIVDDSEIVVTWLRHQLEGVGYDVIAAASPVEAGAMVLSQRPAAIVVDMVMPQIDCGDVIRHVRANDPHHLIPVVLYSGQPLRRLHEAVVRYAVNGCAPKKRDVSELLAELDRCILGNRPSITTPGMPGLVHDVSSQTLFVDDDPAILRAYQRAFADKLDAAFVTSPLDALARLHDGTPPRFVVSDINMPTMSGLDLYSRAVNISDAWRKRFVFVTGSENWLKSRENMHVPVLQKPLTIDRLKAVIARP